MLPQKCLAECTCKSFRRAACCLGSIIVNMFGCCIGKLRYHAELLKPEPMRWILRNASASLTAISFLGKYKPAARIWHEDHGRRTRFPVMTAILNLKLVRRCVMVVGGLCIICSSDATIRCLPRITGRSNSADGEERLEIRNCELQIFGLRTHVPVHSNANALCMYSEVPPLTLAG